MIAALFSNPNWDDEKSHREERIKTLNEQYDEAITLVYYPELREGEEIDWDNPFWSAAKRGIEKTRAKHDYVLQGKKLADVIDIKDADQLRAREASRRDIDQL